MPVVELIDIPVTLGVIEKLLFPVPPVATKAGVVSGLVKVVTRVDESPVMLTSTLTRTTIVSFAIAPTASVTRMIAV